MKTLKWQSGKRFVRDDCRQVSQSAETKERFVFFHGALCCLVQDTWIRRLFHIAVDQKIEEIAVARPFYSTRRYLATLSRFPSKIFLMRYGVFFALGMLLLAHLRGHRSKVAIGALLPAGSMCIVEIFVGRDLLWGIGHRGHCGCG
ncbi:hypothetical protein [Rhizobium mongolense]|uniref:hypothetical protein n=1 Tax=Rhizobium mongolense TaxID=57676 RepID=UPI0034A571C6